MQTELTLQEKLKDLRMERKLTLEQLAEQTKLSRSALGNYESDEGRDISPFALKTLAKFYDVSTDYLLGLTENRKHPDADVASLHLSDEMIELLRSGKINNRLLCEIATHEGFEMLMADMEVYVDGLAAFPTTFYCACLEAGRLQVIQTHHPDKHDVSMRALEIGQLEMTQANQNLIHEELDAILGAVRENHRTDATTSDHDATQKIQGVANEVKTIYETNQFGVTNVRNCINILGFGDCGITNDHIKGIIRFVMLLNKWQLKARQRKRNKLRRKGLPAGN